MKNYLKDRRARHARRMMIVAAGRILGEIPLDHPERFDELIAKARAEAINFFGDLYSLEMEAHKKRISRRPKSGRSAVTHWR